MGDHMTMTGTPWTKPKGASFKKLFGDGCTFLVGEAPADRERAIVCVAIVQRLEQSRAHVQRAIVASRALVNHRCCRLDVLVCVFDANCLAAV